MSTRYDTKGKAPASPTPASAENDATPGNPDEAPISINGFQQVLEMLQIADPQFRESLLRRLAQRDRKLAQSLREDLIGNEY